MAIVNRAETAGRWRDRSLIHFDCVTESHSVGDDGCAIVLLSGAVGLAVQVEK
jgi:hypothetical protein